MTNLKTLALSLACVAAVGAPTIASAQTTISRAAAIAIAEGAGMQAIEEVDRDDGHWEIEGWDRNGREMEIDIHGRSGEILDLERDD